MLDFVDIPTTAFAQTCRLLIQQESNKTLIVDPGESAQVVQIIKQFGLNPEAILLTHGHLDHVGGVADLLKKYPELKVYGPSVEDEPLLNTLAQQAQAFGIESSGNFSTEYVKDGQVLQLFDDASFQVLFTPGHTPGGVCYYCKEENFVLVGDTLFAGSVGRTDFPGGSFPVLLNSIRTKLFTLPDDTEVFCGHGEDTTIGTEKATNPYTRE